MLHQALAGEPGDRLADGRHAHPDLVGQLAVDQLHAWLEPAGHEHPAKFVVGLEAEGGHQERFS